MDSFIRALRACEHTVLADEVAHVYQSNLPREPPALALLLELLSDSPGLCSPSPLTLYLLSSSVTLSPITPGQWENLSVDPYLATY